MRAGVESLIASIRSVSTAEQLPSLSATANGLLANADAPGLVLVAHLTLLQVARLTGDEVMADAEWFPIRKVLDRLADFVEHGDAARLDALGEAWREWRRPAALQ